MPTPVRNYEERTNLTLKEQLFKFNSDLRKVRYGKLNGNTEKLSSGQPYITKSIPDPEESVDSLLNNVTTTGDILLRGGALQPVRTLTDSLRLSKFFFNLKSPEGLLFTAKQNLLSKAGVKTQASDKFLGLNEGAYLPTSTILQAGTGAINGVHLNKNGLNPFAPTTGESITSDIFGINLPGDLPLYTTVDIKGGDFGDSNRLVQLTRNKIGEIIEDSSTQKFLRVNPLSDLPPNNPNSIASDSSQLFSYSGGPGSVAGFGNTVILRYSDTISKNRGGLKEFTKPEVRTAFELFKDKLTFTSEEEVKPQSYSIPNQDIINKDREASGFQEDFRKDKIKNFTPVDYTHKNIEDRVHLGNPGRKGDRTNYQKGKTDTFGKFVSEDKITKSKIYSSGLGPDSNKIQSELNDLIKFRIAAVDSKNPSKSKYMHFRAYLDSFQDNYNASWNDQRYMGRGETFYRYQGFTRTVSLSFKVMASSKQELMPMYHKLNYLASNLTPDYIDNEYMGGPLIRLTVGAYLYEQYGFINSLNLTVPQESPWEIAIPSGNNTSDTNNIVPFSDSSVQELPHMIEVTGFEFIPIHSFAPRKNTTGRTGKQKYIALSSGGGRDGYTNYFGKDQ